MKNLNIFYFDNDLGSFDEFNPRFVMEQKFANDILSLIAIKPPFYYDITNLATKLKTNINVLEKPINLLKNISAITEKSGHFCLNFPFFLDEDIKTIKSIVLMLLKKNHTTLIDGIDLSSELWFDYENEKHRYSTLTPRFFADNGLNVVLIKTSSYFLGVHASVKEAFLSRGNGVIKEYNANLALPTKATGIHPMAFSHTIGEKITRSVNGSNQVILLKRSSDEIKRIKRYLRSTVGKNLLNRDVKWYDGEKIHWDPFVTNLVHTTDNPSEACLHFLIAYPEHQLMTRFMYPNYKLEKESSHERI